MIKLGELGHNFVKFLPLCKRSLYLRRRLREREKIDCLWRISDDQIKGRSQTGNLFDYHPSLLKQYTPRQISFLSA